MRKCVCARERGWGRAKEGERGRTKEESGGGEQSGEMSRAKCYGK